MKERVDKIVAERLGITRSKAQAMIMANQVSVDGKKIIKAGSEIETTSKLTITEFFPYVSRGALKLERAAKEFSISFNKKVVCDIGASTGGFTDYALQNGAKKVYAIDVGRGQLAQKIRENKKVVVMEQTNIKRVRSLPEPIDIFTIDVSFISLKKVLPQVLTIISNSKPQSSNYEIIALIKPQFEVGKEIADRFQGVIIDENIRNEAVKDIEKISWKLGFKIKGVIESPIKGAKGNKEYLIWLK